MRRVVSVVAAVAALAVWQRWPSAAAPTVTFTRDVAPIFYAKCVGCHRPGEVAPMSLLTYADARPWTRAIKEKVVARQMPPWFADPAIGAFANDPRLTSTEIDTIARWVDGGSPQGDVKDLPNPPAFTDGWQMGEPDLVVELPEVQIPATGADYFPTPSLALNLTEDRWLRKGQTLRTNLHYHPNGKPQVDRTKIGFYFGSADLKKEVAAALAGNVTFSIPPQSRNYELRATYAVDQDIDVVSLFPHMHLRGQDMTMTATYPGGRRETLLSVPKYDFNWQLFYFPKTRLSLPQGTRLDLVAHYDNSSANRRNPDPNRTVTFGEASTAEMMFGMFEFTPTNGVSPKPSTAGTRMSALLSSFADSAYLVEMPLPRQTIPSVLYLPRSGEAAWYTPAFTIIVTSPISDLQWTGNAFRFTTSLRVGTGPAPFTVKGAVQDDGSIRGTVEPIGDGRIPFSEFSGRRK